MSIDLTDWLNRIVDNKKNNILPDEADQTSKLPIKATIFLIELAPLILYCEKIDNVHAGSLIYIFCSFILSQQSM